MKLCLHLILVVLALGSALPTPASADSPPPFWDSIAGNWDGMIMAWSDDETLMPAVMRLQYNSFGTLKLPWMGCEIPVKRVEDPPAQWGKGPLYMVDSEDGMCGIVTVAIRIRGKQAQVFGEREGSIEPIGVLIQHWNGRQWLDDYVARYEASYEPRSMELIESMDVRFNINVLIRSMKWKPVVPDEAYAHLAAGNAALLAEEANESALQSAERSYLAAHKLAPWWADALYNLALVYEALGRSEEAALVFGDYLTAIGVTTEDILTKPDVPAYYDLKGLFQADGTDSQRREEYVAWATDIVAYMESMAAQLAALERDRGDYNEALERYVDAGCGASTSNSYLWRECRTKHMELSEWNDQLNARAADYGKAEAFVEELIDEGFRTYKAGEYEKTRHVMQPLAEGGDMNAQYLLGRMYRYGEGVPASESDAVMWLTKAAANGHQKAKKVLDELSNP